MTLKGVYHTLEDSDFLWVLLSVCLLIFVSPLITDLSWGSGLLNLFILLSLLGSIYSIRDNKAHVIASLLIMMVWILTGVLGVMMHDADLNVVSDAVAVVFFAHISLVLLVRVFHQPNVNFDTIAGAISVYFLIGVIGAFIFSVLAGLDPGALDIPQNLIEDEADPHNLRLMLYFSFVTLTTLGYGDITPISNAARIQVYLEALLGQLYLTVLIARLVSQQLSQSIATRIAEDFSGDKP